jgi:hypothetical protein
MSREMLDGKREQSQLLGVRLHSEGKDYYAIRAATVNSMTVTVPGWRKVYAFPDGETVPQLIELQPVA